MGCYGALHNSGAQNYCVAQRRSGAPLSLMISESNHAQVAQADAIPGAPPHSRARHRRTAGPAFPAPRALGTVLRRDLTFANGVVLAPDES